MFSAQFSTEHESRLLNIIPVGYTRDMRIACIYLPSFPLQAHVRAAPHLAGTSLAVSDGAAHGARVVVCSRAAWTDGIRPGMPVATARVIAPKARIVAADRALYAKAVRALAESLLSCSEVIELGDTSELVTAHRTIFLEVPARARGNSFGQKLLTQISRQGFRGRVGVADDRFTAHTAAVRVRHRGETARLDVRDQAPPLFHQSCTSVPRGGSAAFLAPLPLSYLNIDGDVQHLLETCGVKTLGDFAALPPPSVGREWITDDNDFQALARGQGPSWVRVHDLDDIMAQPLVETLELEYGIGDAQPLAFALRKLCDHISHRLVGRQRAASEIELRLTGPESETSRFQRTLSRPTMSSQELLGQVLSALQDELTHPVCSLELEVRGAVEPETAELDLFSQLAQAPRAPLASAVASAASDGVRVTEAPRRPHMAQRRSKRARRRHDSAQQSLRLFD